MIYAPFPKVPSKSDIKKMVLAYSVAFILVKAVMHQWL